MHLTLRTVRAENGYVAVQCTVDVVGGVDCWYTLGSVRYVPPPGHGCYTAFDAGGKVLALCPDMISAIEWIAFDSSVRRAAYP